MKVGPNESCPCGSQKKFKKCCAREAQYAPPVWVANMKSICREHDMESIYPACLSLLENMLQKEWVGACHAMSAYLYLLLCELGHSPVLCCGKVIYPLAGRMAKVFDHSWLTINSHVFDIAICRNLTGDKLSAPVILGASLENREAAQGLYGVDYPGGYRSELTQLIDMTLQQYLSSGDHLWEVLIEMASQAGIHVTADQLSEQYGHTRWTVCQSVEIELSI